MPSKIYKAKVHDTILFRKYKQLNPHTLEYSFGEAKDNFLYCGEVKERHQRGFGPKVGTNFYLVNYKGDTVTVEEENIVEVL